MTTYKQLDDVSTLLNAGKVGVIPTDTVYGLVCQAANPAAVERLYKLKSREQKPGTIIAASVEQLETLGLKHRYVKAVEGYWPNPLSVIIPCSPELTYLHQGKYSLAVRIPAPEKLRTFLQQTGPLLTSSANLPAEPVAVSVKQAADYFGELVDFYVDGGDLHDHEPSTIIRIIDDAIEVIRPGAVHIDENGRISA